MQVHKNSTQAMRTIEALIAQTKGQFFTVAFIKQDGTTHVMNCRTGVKKYLKGTTTVNRSITDVKTPSQYLNVWDATKRAYRSVNKETILWARVGGVLVVL